MCPTPASRQSRASAVVTSLPATVIVPPEGLRSPVSASISSLCPFPSTPAMPTISPARTSKETPRTASRPRSSTHVRGPRPGAAVSPGWAGGFSTRSTTSRPTISRARPSSGGALARNRVDLLALPEHGDPVGDLEHLVQLVGDEDDRLPLRLEGADDREELLRLLRRQDRGRLVEDEDLGAAVERLQDLGPLLHADADGLDPGVRVGPRARTAWRAPGRASRPRQVEERPLASARSRARCSRPPSSPG